MLTNEKKQWQTPELEILNVEETMASGNWGAYDEGYNAALGEQGQVAAHHVS
ncbi:hypothetical protein SAMN03159341_103248 [Paenibacillus sp. 1_12]|uniref:paeninodin family lasso peptide n=1 Tax=Paenibacillus sp. 1_12 TaxID=1566278 RepID=UPI0008E0146A|nr:paeninodin family lasso peptide [Paenibacillus sp. 1_12]SFL10814.1 hypothetical protein SAMN03159341_103248 [Paenibacillus sp. 1_12]